MLLASLFSSLVGIFTIVLRNLEFMCRIKTSTLNTIDVAFFSCAAPHKFRAGQRVSLALGGASLYAPDAARTGVEPAAVLSSAQAEVELSNWKPVHEATADDVTALSARGGGNTPATHGIDVINPLFVSNLNSSSSDDNGGDNLDVDVAAIREQVTHIETTLRTQLNDSARQHAAELAQLRACAHEQQAKVQQLEVAKQRQDAELSRLAAHIRLLLPSIGDVSLDKPAAAEPTPTAPGRGSRSVDRLHGTGDYGQMNED